eukprot:sb/3465727/
MAEPCKDKIPKPINVGLFGVKDAGKTAFLYRMKLGEMITTIPTIGFNLETVKVADFSVDIWEVGGDVMLRPLWKEYYNILDIMLYVVDGSDMDRMEESRTELFKLFSVEVLNNVPIWCVASKSDNAWSLSDGELVKALQLDKVEGREVRLFKFSSVTGDGIANLLDNVAAELKKSVDVIARIEHNEICEQYRLEKEAEEAKEEEEEDSVEDDNWDGVPRIKIFGQEGVGKTTIFYQLLLGTVHDIANPDLTFTREENIKFHDMKFRCFDFSGQRKCQKLWKQYYHSCDAVLFVVSSRDDNLRSSLDLLVDIICHFAFPTDSPVAVLVNRYNGEGKTAVEVEEIWGASFNRRVAFFDVDAMVPESLVEPLKVIVDSV